MLQSTYLEDGYFRSLDRYLDAQNQPSEEPEDFNFILDDGIEFEPVPRSDAKVFVLNGNWRKLSALEEKLNAYFLGVVEGVELAYFDMHDRNKKLSNYCVHFKTPQKAEEVEDTMTQTYNYIAWCDHMHQEPLCELVF